MTKSLFLTAALLGAGLAAAQSSVPALPPGTTAPAITDRLYPSGFRASQLQSVLPLLQGLSSVQGSFVDEQQGRVVVSGASAVDRLELLKRLRAAGLASGIVTFRTSTAGAGTSPTTQTPTTPGASTQVPSTQAPTTQTPSAPATPAQPAPVAPSTVTTLPARAQPLREPHRAALVGPASVRSGEANTWSFTLTNTGTQAIRLQHGACDVRFEVLNAAGQVVRPDPKNTVCTMQLVMTDVAPGQSREVQKIRWEGKDGQGQPLPAGTYTIRAVFDGPALIRAADLKVTVR
ncbi:BsuPI-related putative proteinase inhibitor [Deinococcus hohokamensis]|uniref:Intracellular proteinase inhibitor BsuPI domain-containing protein n=1 Tax=Deinococcus hohokamensis TaxID=309883 RepID=A0ABV9I8D1_9DEIO